MDGHLKFVALTVFVAVCSADWQDGNDGVDRLNGDLLNMPISLKAGARPRDCAQLCYANTQCKAWAFNKPNCNGSVTAECYLKAEITQQSTNPCKVSCIEYYHNVTVNKLAHAIANPFPPPTIEAMSLAM